VTTKFPIVPTAAHTLTEATLKSGVLKTFTFLSALMEHPELRGYLKPAGWNEEVEAAAWDLVASVTKRPSQPVPPVEENPAIAAIRDCELFCTTRFGIARAVLQLSYPVQAELVCGGLVQGSKGAEAVLMAASFIERVGELHSGSDRKATRKQDHAALAAIATTGITTEFLHELKASVSLARSYVATEPTTDVGNEGHLEKLRMIHAWNKAWAEIARMVVPGRAGQIRLGIAKRRAPKAKGSVVPVVTPPPVVRPSPLLAQRPVPSNVVEEKSPESRAA
jgi:hypothetical protein